ncbi:MAG TPA: MBL fold metallo-hydrolase [Sphingomonas sp.]|uniref:MBL fold metallo-hydrolase n=1 Tax=Sphingomonas sp. TaxID=28214 RepID=UPI002C9ACCA3|nr:MBL fold metallo-hydrolase [Sphingomonas sp.]HMI20540.1 MBL fold metallo-hydrolase [Sphingomonas sp.]
MSGKIMRGLAAGLLALLAAGAAWGDVGLTPLGGDAALLAGSSCNVVVVRSDAGLLLIDDQRARDYAETRGLLDANYHLPVTEVINTHWHLDHAGGNEAFATAGATIVAQDNVRARLSQPQYMTAYARLIPASAAIAWPGKTYRDGLTIRFGQEEVRLVHIANAHTDGDTLVKLERANVLHMGDVYFNGLYPFIDLSSGGSIQGMIRAVEAGLRLSDANTRIVPGHGAVARRAELMAYRDMLVAVDRDVRGQISRGHDLATILASHPATGYALEGDADRMVAAIYANHTLPGGAAPVPAEP